MIWRKIRLMWLFWFLPLGIGELIREMANGEMPVWTGVLLIAFGSLIIIRVVSLFLQLQPEEVAAEEKNRREMWFVIALAIGLILSVIIGWSLITEFERPSETEIMIIVWSVLTPAVLFTLTRSMRRSAKAKKDAAERIVREL